MSEQKKEECLGMAQSLKRCSASLPVGALAVGQALGAVKPEQLRVPAVDALAVEQALEVRAVKRSRCALSEKSIVRCSFVAMSSKSRVVVRSVSARSSASKRAFSL